jgi:PRC-barrel domain
MRTYFVFQATKSPGLRGFTDDPTGAKLPAEDGPWTLSRTIEPDVEWDVDISRAVVAAGIMENGFYLTGPLPRPASSKPVIESDRVEGTAVVDSNGSPIGTIKRLLIEKVSGHVLYVDVTFGGFLGMGVHHLTIPWERLTYDREFGAYRTDITEAQARGAPDLRWDHPSTDQASEREFQNYWRGSGPRGH